MKPDVSHRMGKDMRERTFKEHEKDTWLYPKLLLVVIGCSLLAALLGFWLPSSIAVGLGFIPFVVLFGFIGRPVTYRQWLLRILIALLSVGTLMIILHFVRLDVGS